MASENDNDILDLIRSMPADNLLCRQVEAVLSGLPAANKDPGPILRALASGSPSRRKERAVAEWLLKKAGWSDDQKNMISERLCGSLGGVVKAAEPGRVQLQWFCLSIVVALYLSFGWTLYDSRHSSNTSVDPYPYVFGTLYFGVMLTVLGSLVTLPTSTRVADRGVRRWSSVVDVLGRLGQPASLAILGRASVLRSLRQAAASALAAVTARLRPEDYGTLPRGTIPALCRALCEADGPTVLVILHALGFIGDGRAIDSVERLARTAQSPDVREVATNLLPILYQRAEESQSASLLLHPSSVAEAGGQVLLRAASGSADTDASELLVWASEEPGESAGE